MITYTMQDSEPAYYTMKELLKFGEENGKTVVAGYLTSNLYWEDGKVHHPFPVRNRIWMKAFGTFFRRAWSALLAKAVGMCMNWKPSILTESM